MPRRHSVLTHLGWPAKRFVYFTGPELLAMLGAVLLAVALWQALLPAAVGVPVPTPVPTPAPGVVPTPTPAGETGPMQAPPKYTTPPLVVWAREGAPAWLGPSVERLAPWLPLLAVAGALGAASALVLWEPEGRKLHRWAAVVARSHLRIPKTVTWQPDPRRTRGARR